MVYPVFSGPLAFTAKRPLLLDFDRGSYRAVNRTDYVRVDKWEDVVGITAEDIKNFDTIILDTAGQMLAVMVNYLQANNKSAVRKNTGELSIQGYGILKSMFDTFMNRLIQMGKDVILIAHDKEQKIDDENTLIKPDVVGGSYQIIKRSMDLIGYVNVDDKGSRILEFNSTAKTVGKNCANFSTLQVPDAIKGHNEYSGYLANLIQQAKDFINVQCKSGKDLFDFRRKIIEATEPEQLDAIANELSALKDKDENFKSMIRAIMRADIVAKNIAYNKEAGKFYRKEEGVA
ncbi:MAG TPA: ATP-binding protein [Flavobacteriales bacterium]|nr:ATP-binding protein [Flavobacteriales bacterium]